MTTRTLLQRDHEAQVEDLSKVVSDLKDTFKSISITIQEGEPLVEQIQDGVEVAGNLLKGNLVKVGSLLESKSTMHMCY
jgi:t-SNARE complex subunit (syntaxin)